MKSACLFGRRSLLGARGLRETLVLLADDQRYAGRGVRSQ